MLKESVAEKPFHTPSFGDEDFEVPSSHPVPPGTMTAGVPNTMSQQGPAPPGYQPTSELSHSPSHQQSYVTQSDLSQSQSLSHSLTTLANNRIQHNSLTQNGHFQPKFPPPNFEIPDIRESSYQNNMLFPPIPFYSSPPTYHQLSSLSQSRPMLPGHLGTINQSHLGSQLGFPLAPGLGGGFAHAMNNNHKLSPPGSTNTSPGIESSEESSDDSIQLALKRSSAVAGNTDPMPMVPKKPKAPKKRKKKDPNEPQKPVSAYALFFRDTQAAIKGSNPNASFGEVSKIVASMWDNLDADQKAEFKKKTEVAKKEYLKQLAAYRASLVSKQNSEGQMSPYGESSPMGNQKSILAMSPPPAPTTSTNSTSPPVSVTSLNHFSPPPPGLHSMAAPMGQGMPGGADPQLSMLVPQHHGSMSQIGGGGPPPHMSMPHSPPGHSMPLMSSHNMPHMQMGHPGGMYSMSPEALHNPPHHHAPQGMAGGGGGGSHSGAQCQRSGCQNIAIDNPAWDANYCSNQCVMSNCRDVFSQWTASRQTANPYSSVK